MIEDAELDPERLLAEVGGAARRRTTASRRWRRLAVAGPARRRASGSRPRSSSACRRLERGAAELRRPAQLHFIAIGGAGMSGLALVCHALGAEVTGSDRAESTYLERLRAAGIEPRIGHDADAVPPDAEVVVSTAIAERQPGAGAAPASAASASSTAASCSPSSAPTSA